MSDFPVRSSMAADIEIDRHRIIYNTNDQGVRLLDPVGSLIWSLLDREASAPELARDLGAAFGLSFSQISDELEHFLELLERDGLLDPSPAVSEPTTVDPLVLANPPSP